LLLAAQCPFTAALAASPRAELLRLVPEDVGFCLILEDLGGHGTALANSPFVDQFRASSLGTKIRNAPETQKLTELEKFIQRSLDLSAGQLRDDILGDALALAYRPGPSDKPDEEEGLFLIRARDATLLARLVERINILQKETGDLEELEQREYRGRKYYRRVERVGGGYYYLRGPVLAFAPQEGILRQVIDRDRDASMEVEAPVARQLRLLGIEKCLAALWINPRAFDKALQQQAAPRKGAAAGGSRGLVLRTLSAHWNALEGIALAVALDNDLTLSLAIRARADELPASTRRLVLAAAQPSEVWQSFPDNALLTMGGRLDLPALVEILTEFLADDARKSLRAVVEGTVEAILGKDIVKELLPKLGPDWGLCVLAPPAGEKGWVPEVIAALRVHHGVGEPAELSVWSALDALATVAVFHHNRGQPGPLSLKSALQEKTEVKYLANREAFPPGLEPAFARKGGYLLLASAPEAIRRYRNASNTIALPGGDVPLINLSVRGWCQFLNERREPLLECVAAKNRISKEEASQRLDPLLVALQLFDRVELTQRTSPGLVTLSLRVRTAKPLR
jgi:hypothetical protein